MTAPTMVLPPNDEDLGPAMRDLTVPQRMFVIAYSEQGGVNATEAARLAGYGGPESNRTSREGERLLRMPRILAALREEADKRLKSGAILAASVLVEIAMDPIHKERYKAAVELLNRAGLVVEGISRVIVEDHRTVEEIERRIRDLAEKVGIDPERLLGMQTVEDVEYTEMEETVAGIHRFGDEWQEGQKEFDALMERSE